jgi:hypothetical protein
MLAIRWQEYLSSEENQLKPSQSSIHIRIHHLRTAMPESNSIWTLLSFSLIGILCASVASVSFSTTVQEASAKRPQIVIQASGMGTVICGDGAVFDEANISFSSSLMIGNNKAIPGTLEVIYPDRQGAFLDTRFDGLVNPHHYRLIITGSSLQARI